MMEVINKAATFKTPKVLFNLAESMMIIRGRSLMEHAVNFYNPLIEWMVEYCKQNKEPFNMQLGFEYINSDSSKCLFELLKAIEETHPSDSQISIEWLYEKDDDDLLKMGETFSKVLTMKFTFIEVEEI